VVGFDGVSTLTWPVDADGRLVGAMDVDEAELRLERAGLEECTESD